MTLLTFLDWEIGQRKLYLHYLEFTCTYQAFYVDNWILPTLSFSGSVLCKESMVLGIHSFIYN